MTHYLAALLHALGAAIGCVLNLVFPMAGGGDER